MNKRDKEAFIKNQMRNREALMLRLQQEHGRRTVEMALRHLDTVTDMFPSGMDSVPKICIHLREKRGTSRSWSLACRIFVELLKNLGEHLEVTRGRRVRRISERPGREVALGS